MKYKSFGKTGIKVSELILGTWYLPNQVVDGKRRVNKQASIKLINRAYDLGINFFDTADVYRGVYERDKTNFDTVGLAEKIVGEALKGYDRESFVVSTKVVGKTGPLVNDSGANRKHVRNAISKSLERLQMDYVDFYIIHGPDDSVGIEQTSKTMNLLEEEGLILHYGISNHSALDLVKYLNLRYFSPLEPPDFIQDKYNLLERELEKTNVKVAEDNSLASMIYSPLAQGVLAGRYFEDDRTNSRLDYEKWFSRTKKEGYEGYGLHERNKTTLKKFRDIAKSKDITMSQLALSWLLNKGKYLFPIIGATRIEQLEENVKSTEVSLGPEETDELSKMFECK
jgi:aryl-alcohol dehydrogenase-like predicted oxidoreductase